MLSAGLNGGRGANLTAAFPHDTPQTARFRLAAWREMLKAIVDPISTDPGTAAVNAGPIDFACARCGERVGVYEPLWLQRADGRFLATGLIAVRKHLRREGPGLRLFHRGCVQLGQAQHREERRPARERRLASSEARVELARVEQPAGMGTPGLEGAFADAPTAIGIVGLDGLLLRANRSFCQLTGWTEPELQERTLAEAIDARDLHEHREQLGRLLRNEIGVYRIEKYVTRRSGGSAWVRLSLSLARSPDGRPAQFVVVLDDISERKRLEHALERQRTALTEAQRLASVSAAITGSLPEGFLLTREAAIAEVNPALCRLTGFAHDELLGARAPYPFWATDTEAQIRRQWPLFGAGEHAQLELGLTRKDGTAFDASITVVVARGADGEPFGQVWVIRELSDEPRRS